MEMKKINSGRLRAIGYDVRTRILQMPKLKEAASQQIFAGAKGCE